MLKDQFIVKMNTFNLINRNGTSNQTVERNDQGWWRTKSDNSGVMYPNAVI